MGNVLRRLFDVNYSQLRSVPRLGLAAHLVDYTKRVLCNQRGEPMSTMAALALWAAMMGGAYKGGEKAGWWGDKDKNKAQPGGAQWYQNPQWSFTQPMLQGQYDFYQKGMEGLNRGESSPYFEGMSNIMRTQGQQQLDKRFLGSDTSPGALKQMKAFSGSQNRLRGPEAGKGYSGLLQERTQQEQGIEEFINKLRYQDWYDSANLFSGVAKNPYMQGPQGQWVGYGQSPAQPSGMDEAMGGMSELLPYLMQMQGGQTPKDTGGGYDSMVNNLEYNSRVTPFEPQYDFGQDQNQSANTNWPDDIWQWSKYQ